MNKAVMEKAAYAEKESQKTLDEYDELIDDACSQLLEAAVLKQWWERLLSTRMRRWLVGKANTADARNSLQNVEGIIERIIKQIRSLRVSREAARIAITHWKTEYLKAVKPKGFEGHKYAYVGLFSPNDTEIGGLGYKRLRVPVEELSWIEVTNPPILCWNTYLRFSTAKSDWGQIAEIKWFYSASRTAKPFYSVLIDFEWYVWQGYSAGIGANHEEDVTLSEV